MDVCVHIQAVAPVKHVVAAGAAAPLQPSVSGVVATLEVHCRSGGGGSVGGSSAAAVFMEQRHQ